MIRRTSQTLTAWFVVWDLGLTALAWLGSYWLRFNLGVIPYDPEIRPDVVLYLRTLPLILLLAIVSYRVAGMYEVHRLRRFREELVAVAKGVALMALAVMATSFAGQFHYESRLAMLMFVTGALFNILVARRISWKAVRKLRARGVNQSHALIVGTGRLARRTVRTLRSIKWSGIRAIGYVEDEAHRGPAAALDLPVVGSIAELPELVERHTIHHVFIALPLNRYADARRVFAALSQTLVDVQLIADLPQMAGMTFHTTQLHGMTVIGLRESPHHGLNVVVKRAMDILLSALAILVLAPVMLVIAGLIKLTSRGPVLYKQERCGLNGLPFNMLKFRTMRLDAEAGGPQMTAANDPRKTWARHAVKAGITGWAQVNGWRGNSSLRRRVQFDLYYITHWNPLFDLRIMLLTVWRMLFQKQKHAY
jgi:lipopolysaccharide/colanic/teichoic acid biosynthesis glycosyltransferase